jgi:hypothetical protein
MNRLGETLRYSKPRCFDNRISTDGTSIERGLMRRYET